MSEQTPVDRRSSPTNRRSFIGGSDARIIMGTDEAALQRLWREKRGEAEPEDLSGNLVVQLGTGDEAAWWHKAGIDPTVAAHEFWLQTHPLSGCGAGD